MKKYYTYIFLDPRKPGQWKYQDWVFLYKPFYVGKGQGDRINSHLKSRSLKEDNHKNAIIRKILKLNLEPIRIKTIENATEADAFEHERKIIETFGRKSNGDGFLTNVAAGGPGVKGLKMKNNVKKDLIERLTGAFIPSSKRISQFDLNGFFINTWDNLMAASRGTGISSSSISAATYSDNGKSKGFIWRFDGTSPYEQPEQVIRKLGKDVFKYTLKGHYVAQFNKIKDACASVSKSSSSLVFKQDITVQYGYQWSKNYIGEKIPSAEPFVEPPYFLNRAMIFQYTLQGDFVRSFNSLSEVSNLLGMVTQNIYYCLKGKYPQANDFQWKSRYLGEKIEAVVKYAQEAAKTKIYVYDIFYTLIEIVPSYREARDKYGKFRLYDHLYVSPIGKIDRRYIFSHHPLLESLEISLVSGD